MSKETTMEKHHTKLGTTLRTPDICADFSGNNSDPVQFQKIPAGGVTLSQDGSNWFPFTPKTQGANGYYTVVQQGGQVIIAVPAINQTYTYLVSVCPQDTEPKSVTVNN